MLHQVYIILNNKIIYQRNYAKGLDKSLFLNLLPKIFKDAFSKFNEESGIYNFFKWP